MCISLTSKWYNAISPHQVISRFVEQHMFATCVLQICTLAQYLHFCKFAFLHFCVLGIGILFSPSEVQNTRFKIQLCPNPYKPIDTQAPAGPGILRHCPGYFESCVLISREPDAKTPYIAYACLCMHRHTYSVQCSDKICFPQLCIKCGAAKSCPGTHTALQVPMHRHSLKSLHYRDFLKLVFAAQRLVYLFPGFDSDTL